MMEELGLKRFKKERKVIKEAIEMSETELSDLIKEAEMLVSGTIARKGNEVKIKITRLGKNVDSNIKQLEKLKA